MVLITVQIKTELNQKGGYSLYILLVILNILFLLELVIESVLRGVCVLLEI